MLEKSLAVRHANLLGYWRIITISKLFRWLAVFFGFAYFVVYFSGGIAILGIFISGIYVIFSESVLFGLAMIGAALVASWILPIIAGLIMALGTVCARHSTFLDDSKEV